MMPWTEQWESFLREKLVPAQFPREVGHKLPSSIQLKTSSYVVSMREKVKSVEAYIDYLTSSSEKVHCYTSMFSFPQMDKRIVDSIYLEIDANNIYDAESRAKILEELLTQRRLKFRKYFSGRRGYHYYIDHPAIKLKNPQLVIKAFASSIPENILDSHCVGNIRQMVRVPYTKHAETGLYCYRLHGKFRVEDAIDPPKIRDFLEINDSLAETMRAMDSAMDAARAEVRGEVEEVAQSIDLFPQCVVDCMVELETTHELDHAQRLHMTSFLGRAGYSVDQLVDLYRKNASDFSERLTHFHVKGLLKSNFKCYMCKNAKLHGICPYSDEDMKHCRFFPSINRRVRYDFENGSG